MGVEQLKDSYQLTTFSWHSHRRCTNAILTVDDNLNPSYVYAPRIYEEIWPLQVAFQVSSLLTPRANQYPDSRGRKLVGNLSEANPSQSDRSAQYAT
jgi:hypothetical protein